jgi:hypothetical protein
MPSLVVARSKFEGMYYIPDRHRGHHGSAHVQCRFGGRNTASADGLYVYAAQPIVTISLCIHHLAVEREIRNEKR